uniref:L1 transposable element RRM domain-containing protein n=1 Tax=Labrus bergylta TaxID=56723 RepID=A0A3Q3GCY7_9LABR
MNLCSGAVLKEEKTKKKKVGRKKQATNTLANMEEDAGGSLEGLLISMKEDITAQIKDFRSEFQHRSNETKEDISKLKPEIRDLKTALNSTRNYVSNKSTQNNIKIHQVMEETEGGDMVNMFISKKLEIPSEQLNIVTAHRSNQRKSTHSGTTPRSIVVTFLTWDIRQKVLRSARARKAIMHEGRRIYFDQDYSTKIQKERSQYAFIRRQGSGFLSLYLDPAELEWRSLGRWWVALKRQKGCGRERTVLAFCRSRMIG